MGRNSAPRGSGNSGRGHGRHNRHQGRSNHSSNSQKPKATTKAQPLMKFGVQNSKDTYAPFATVVEKITEHVQKSYDYGYDIARSVRDGQVLDLSGEQPTRDLAIGTKAQKAALQPAMDIEFNLRLSKHLK